MTPPDADAHYYAVWQARDRRYDGKIFMGVRTTGIYCRPICPARTPLRKNVTFHATAAAAEAAGFRPCLRCRPESGPGTPAWMGTSASVSRALKLIAEGMADVPGLSSRLGLGERQLRRLFVEHLGAPPLAIIQTRRLDLARKLLDETSLPVSEIALASGFDSIRRFNDAFKSRFGGSPSRLRREDVPSSDRSLRLLLPYRPPLDFRSLLNFLGDRAIPGVESCDAHSYSRTFELDGVPAWLLVTASDREGPLELRLSTGAHSARNLLELITRVRRLLDLDADPLAIGEQLGRTPLLEEVVRRHPGLRVPGAWDGFEIAVRAILGQQISVAGARTVAQRITVQYGKPVQFEDQPALTHLFPTPAVLAEANLAPLGITRSRAQTIRELARRISIGELSLHPSQDMSQVIRALRAIPGIGEWTADYISMRVLGNPDALLETDLIVRRQLGSTSPVAYSPWGSYATLYFWTLASLGPKETPRALLR